MPGLSLPSEPDTFQHPVERPQRDPQQVCGVFPVPSRVRQRGLDRDPLQPLLGSGPGQALPGEPVADFDAVRRRVRAYPPPPRSTGLRTPTRPGPGAPPQWPRRRPPWPLARRRPSAPERSLARSAPAAGSARRPPGSWSCRAMLPGSGRPGAGRPRHGPSAQVRGSSRGPADIPGPCGTCPPVRGDEGPGSSPRPPRHPSGGARRRPTASTRRRRGSGGAPPGRPAGGSPLRPGTAPLPTRHRRAHTGSLPPR